jgi:Zn finger protein HypA/HybF involved in hydrogenase expression
MEAYKIECMNCKEIEKIEVHKFGDNKIIIYCPECNRITIITRGII